MQKLPEMQLTDMELKVLGKHWGEIQRLRAEAGTREEAMQDIVNLALEARGLDGTKYLVDYPQGNIRPKDDKKEQEPKDS